MSFVSDINKVKIIEEFQKPDDEGYDLTVNQIASRVGVSVATVYHVLQDYGLSSRHRNTWRDAARQEEVDKVCALYNAGDTLLDIEMKTGVTPQTVYRYLKQGGVELRRHRSGNVLLTELLAARERIKELEVQLERDGSGK